MTAMVSTHGTGAQAHVAPLTYTVLTSDLAPREAAVTAIRAAGGTIIGENHALGALRVTASDTAFVRKMSGASSVAGVARNQPIGRVARRTIEGPLPPVTNRALSQGTAAELQAKGASPRFDPLDASQWGLSMVRADLARNVQAGRNQVLVGILSTGVDRSHPDLAENIDVSRSRTFVRDIPVDALGQLVDGPCEFRGCVDPVGVDHNGTGTALAGVVAAAVNGLGISGVAPRATLVDVRVGQDSGFVFLQPVIEGITYAADAGVDVAMLGFFVDRWRFNCVNNPADTPEDQLEQRTVITAMTRALNYAHRKGMTLIAPMGDGHEDLGTPLRDVSSPTFPENTSYPREIDNATCAQLPVEGPHVLGVSALGPFGGKSDYSSYGLERISLAGPGGYFRDGFGTPTYRTNENMILSTTGRDVLLANGWIDQSDNVTPDGEAAAVIKACSPTGCAFYRYQQGTAFAAAHAAGVAALIVSELGQGTNRNNWGLNPDVVRRVLQRTAASQSCPVPPTVSYVDVGHPVEFDATCSGTPEFNGFYGHGIVDAYRAVTQGRRFAAP